MSELLASFVRSIFMMVCRRHVSLSKPTCEPVLSQEKNEDKLFAILGSVRVVKNCDLRLKNAAEATVFHYMDHPAGK